MNDTTTKLAINGAAGRMGQRLIGLAGGDERFELVCAVEAKDHPFIGQEIGGVAYTDRLLRHADVVVDFSGPAGTEAVLPAALNDRTAMVIGTTGLSPHVQSMIDEAANEVPVVQAPNFSIAVNVLGRLVANAAELLGADYDIEIVEAHHRFKQDAPSGTALALARGICRAIGADIEQVLAHGRSGVAPRQAGQIGMHAIRLGDTVGEHAVHFGGIGETLILAHSAHTRDTFAGGALRAAAWAVTTPPGKYTMADVLFGS